MSRRSRERLADLLRRNDADPAEAVLLCEAEAHPGLDVDAVLLRVDALADTVRTRGGDPRPAPGTAAGTLAAVLATDHDFRGADATRYHAPESALLTGVLDSRRGLPVTLSALYVAVARRLGVPAFPIHLPGHVVVGVADARRPVVLDPFHGGEVLDEAGLTRLVDRVSGGQAAFHRAMLRPVPTVDLVRRLLHNLTRAYHLAERPFDAVWTVELKLLLPNRTPDDHRVHGDVLWRAGRFDAAARAYEAYLAATDASAPHREQVRRSAVRAQARLN